MADEYVMDTSAVRGLSNADLAAAAKRWRVTVSPLSVYEILCHLDEPVKRDVSAADAFAFRKNHVLKCQHLELRDDPFAEQAVAVGATASVNKTRLEDRVVVPQIYPLLEAAASLEEFHAMTVTYPDGRKGSLREVSGRARDVLDLAEKQYIAFVHTIRDELVRVHGFQGALDLDGLDYVRYIDQAARGLERHYTSDGVSPPGGAVFSAVFLHVGYVLARTRLYMSRVGDGASLPVDANDMEDAAILLHLDLTQPRVLVTSDGGGKRPGTIEAFNEAISHLKSASHAVGAEVVALPRVITPNAFRAILAVPPPEP